MPLILIILIGVCSLLINAIFLLIEPESLFEIGEPHSRFVGRLNTMPTHHTNLSAEHTVSRQRRIIVFKICRAIKSNWNTRKYAEAGRKKNDCNLYTKGKEKSGEVIGYWELVIRNWEFV